MKYDVVYTDTFSGEPNYSWVRRETIRTHELTHYGYDGGTNYAKANRRETTHAVRLAKKAVGISGVRGITYDHGDSLEFRPYGICSVLFITPAE